MSPDVAVGIMIGVSLVILPLIVRYPAQTAFAVLCIALLYDCVKGMPQPGINLGVLIYADDLACATMMIAVILLVIRSRSISHDICWPGAILLAMAMLNFLRGAIQYGVRPSGNGTRDLVYLVIPVVAVSSTHLRTRLRVYHITAFLCAVSFAFLAVAILRWGGVLSISEYSADPGDFRTIIRVLPADFAMVIGQAFIVLVGMRIVRGTSPVGMLAAASFGVTLLALQHRSVWVATAIGIIWLVSRTWKYAGREWGRIGAIGLGGAMLGVVLLTAFGRTENAFALIENNVKETQQSDSTWAWRVNGFTEATERTFTSGFIEATIGPAAGRDMEGIASVASVHIHDRYVEILAYYGVLGLLTFLWWLWTLVERLQSMNVVARKRRDVPFEAVLLESLLISQITYFVAYFGGIFSGVMLGIIWIATSREVSQLSFLRTQSSSAA